MKKYILGTLFTVVLIGAVSFNGCILDAFKTLTQNIPISKEFNVNSSATSYSRTEVVNLDSSSIYQRYQDKIQEIKFVRAEYRTKSVAQSDLSGDISITVTDLNDNKLFSVTLSQIKPADYLKTPFELSINQAEINAFNSYLSTLSNKQFKVKLEINNISPTPYQFTGVVDMVFEMKANT